MTDPSTETDQQKALAAARELFRAILSWECFKDPTLAELAEMLRRLSVTRGRT
jgi:hypothetical protein